MMSALRLCSSLRGSRLFARRRDMFVRGLHKEPVYPYNLNEGLGEFLPAPALKALAVDYQEGLLKRLNEQIRGTEYENMTIVDTLVKSATKPMDVLTFNFASLALNNHFFLDQLTPACDKKSHQSKISDALRTNIIGQFGSLPQLKSTFSSASLGMFSSGYVWLVTDKAGRLAVVPTFGAASLLVRARKWMGPGATDSLQNLELLALDFRDNDPYRTEFEREGEQLLSDMRASWLQGEDARIVEEAQNEEAEKAEVTQHEKENNHTPSYSQSTPGTPRQYHTSARRLVQDPSTFNAQSRPASVYDGKMSADEDMPSIQPQNRFADVLYPLFCVPVQQQAWISAGYGIWGQEEWMTKYWTVLDWEKISKRYSQYAPITNSREQQA